MVKPSPSEPAYPYTRSEECSWQPEDVARHLLTLVSSQQLPFAGSATAAAAVVSKIDISNTSTQLLSHGLSSRSVPRLRHLYGPNQLPGDAANNNYSVDGSDDQAGKAVDWSQRLSCLKPIFSALVTQLKEPLILMLLGSAGISVVLGNTADAISISIALLIVGMVAAVQEFRSEAALEKLGNLVPHQCTILRDGRVLQGFFARDLVVGDLVLLSTGE